MSGRNENEEVDRLLEFRERQRARYLMPAARLAIELAKESGSGAHELFGASVLTKPDADEDRQRTDRARFRDELAALRAFVRAVVHLDGANGQMSDLGRNFPGDGARGRRDKATIRIAGRGGSRGLSFDDTRNARRIDDFVDVGLRLRDLPPAQIELLVEFYVFGCSAERLAQYLGCCTSSIGGRLTQSRRALREALRPLLPQPDDETTGHVAVPATDLAVRRAKVSRFLRRRMDASVNGEVRP